MSAPIIDRKGFMFVISSPSGAGKTTLSRLLLEADDNIIMSISATTRKKRDGEVDGKDYHFIDKEKFNSMVNAGEFLEHAEVFGNFYGTPAKVVDAAMSIGKDVLFDIDWQGTKQLAKSRRQDLVTIFILPPSMKELDKRLHKRAQDSEDVIKGRMSKASDEISHWSSYDYVIVNYDIEISLQQIKSILQAERLKSIRQHGLKTFVDGLGVNK